MEPILSPSLGSVISYPSFLHPVLVNLGPVTVHWYGVMYLMGFGIGRVILRQRARKGLLPLSNDGVDDFLLALFVGMLVGARALYMTVYYVPPEGRGFRLIDIIAVWEGGLAFHGALLGMVAAIAIFAWRTRVSVGSLLDGLAAAAPPGLFLGRIGNFINAELYGRPTDVPWAMQFPIRDQTGAIVEWTSPRHPSQIYQGVTEGLLAWALVWYLAPRIKRRGLLFAIGIGWYAIARFIVEFFREKDAQLNYLFGWMTMGQFLCLLMLTGAVGYGVWLVNHPQSDSMPTSPEDTPKAAS